MAPDLLEDDILPLKPDCCFIHFGVNDMGIWLYDGEVEETREVLLEREERDALYFEGMKRTVERLKEKGIQPILCSPIAVNEYLIEKENIETVADNKEKGELIEEGFYKRKTFQNINFKLAQYSKKLKEYAEKERVFFFDLYAKTYSKMQTIEGMFGKDGIHLTSIGQEELAKSILEYLGCLEVFSSFETCKKTEEIARKESLIRKIQYVKWAMFHPFLGYKETELDKNVQEALKEELPRHKKEALLAYLEWAEQLFFLQIQLVESMKD